MINLRALYPEFEAEGFIFRDRGTVLPGDRRPLWRVALVMLLLKQACRGASSSLSRLHVLDWAVRSKHGRDQIVGFLNGNRPASFSPVRFDPALLRALQFARAEHLVAAKGGNIALTDKGLALAAEIEAEADLLRVEKAVLAELGKKFTEKASEAFVKIGEQYELPA